ncbi:MAG: Lrp/AsnC family transcriptional regulator [Aestuariivirga sp.]|uniref:Lrp/AsnC family transcriptional regulator n=1 Tax=Aestuariivirga sp. TaxID=2650926 RepID=UPI0038D1A82B
MRRLGDFERALLHLLAENSRRSITELALRLKTTRPRVRRCLAELESSGVIKRYTIEVSADAKIQSKSVRAVFVVKTRMTRCRVLIDKIKPWPEVVGIRTFSSRDVDLQIEVAVSGDAELEALRDRIARDPSVENMYTMPILSEWSRR